MAGLRERKKRRTKQYISDVATGLFLQRGFDQVTVAEIAETADVSVNTVYNYFPAKEDLFFDRKEEVIEYPARCVRERGPGVSAAEALLAAIRQDVEDRNVRSGLNEGHIYFMRCVRDSPVLSSRLMRLHYLTSERLTETLREEAGAAPGDHTPEVVAMQLMVLNGVVHRTVAAGAWKGLSGDETAQLVFEKLKAAEALLSPTVLDYARQPEA